MSVDWEGGQLFPKLLPIPLHGHALPIALQYEYSRGTRESTRESEQNCIHRFQFITTPKVQK